MKKIALAGNPNCGKTTLFNSLTGSTAHVGNWPGVTVDKREGRYKKLDEPLYVVDLPGIYSLSPYTPEEVVSRNFILDEKPDVVINVVDATNLERNLYLTTQLLEIDVPIVIALNMSDVVRKEGGKIDAKKLSKTIGVPVIEISALKHENLDELMLEAFRVSNTKRVGYSVIEDKALSHLINDIKIGLKANGVDHPLFHAVKLIENDEIETKMHPDLVEMVNEFKESHSDETFGSDYEAMIADARYNYITNHYSSAYKSNKGKEKLSKSDKIDKVLTHRVWSLFIFAAIMFFVFHFVFSNDLFFIGRIGAAIQGVPYSEYVLISDPGWVRFFTANPLAPLEEVGTINGIPSLGVFLQSWFSWVFDALGKGIANVMPPEWYTSLLVDGLITGVGMVAGFIPLVILLYFFLAILEDSGYMARVAFILDRAFRKFGLSGRAFIPMLTSFGCAVPGIFAARTIEDEKERNTVIRVLTCFPCGAKSEILAFFSQIPALVGLTISGDIFVFTIYLSAFGVAILFALLMKLFSRQYRVSPFIMELPAYHLPQAHNVFALLWDKFKHYIVKAGTIIAASSILIWFLSRFNWNLTLGMVDVQYSMLSDIGRGLSYFFYPLGWVQIQEGVLYGWEYSVATLTGLVAKENFVATLEQLVDFEAMQYSLSASGVYSLVLYNMFTLPCFAAIGAAFGEQSRKQFAITMIWWFLSSYVICAFVNIFGIVYAATLWGGILLTIGLIATVISIGLIVYKVNKKEAVQVI